MSFIEDFTNAKARYELAHGPGSFMAKKVHRQHWIAQEAARRERNARKTLWQRMWDRLTRLGL